MTGYKVFIANTVSLSVLLSEGLSMVYTSTRTYSGMKQKHTSTSHCNVPIYFAFEINRMENKNGILPKNDNQTSTKQTSTNGAGLAH